jgi:uncharacterized protein YukJ
VIAGSAKDGICDPADSSRYEIKIDCGGTLFRVSVRIRSTAASAITAYFSPALATVTRFNIPALAESISAFRPLEVGPQIGEGLDYLRDGSLDLNAMENIPEDGSRISLANLVDILTARAIHTDAARVVAFGQAFKDGKPDKTFHFSPSWAMHDVHMMQGAPTDHPFGVQNRVYGDGALFMWFPPERKLAALFTRFQSQEIISDQDGTAAAAMWHRG